MDYEQVESGAPAHNVVLEDLAQRTLKGSVNIHKNATNTNKYMYTHVFTYSYYNTFIYEWMYYFYTYLYSGIIFWMIFFDIYNLS